MIAANLTNMNSSPLLFLKRFLNNPAHIGAIAPTSLATARKMSAPINPEANILELGAGTGTITQAILERIKRQDQLTSVEIDPHLAAILRQNFPSTKILIEDIEETLKRDAKYDIIISGIPFVSMNKEKRNRVFKLIKEQLAPDGQFIAFQYSLYTKRELERIFDHVEIKFSLWNLPPAFIYFCKKS